MLSIYLIKKIYSLKCYGMSLRITIDLNSISAASCVNIFRLYICEYQRMTFINIFKT